MSKWFEIAFILFCICFILWLIRKQIKENLLQDDPKLRELRKLFEIVFYKDRKYTGKLSILNDRDIMEEISFYKGDKSYSINKQKIFLCLRDEEGKYYNNNILVYVTAHEISHCINNKNIGHTEEFHEIFEEVLDLATKEGIYNPSIPIPETYCTYNDKQSDDNY